MKITILSAVAALMLQACAAEPVVESDDDTPIPQGLTVFTDTPEEGLTAMFAEGEEVVFVETLRSVEHEPGPVHQTYLPDGTPVNIDVRFSDMEGRDLVVSLASEELPPQWHRTPPSFDDDDVGRRAVLGTLITKATVALLDADIASAMEPEVARVTLLGEFAPKVAEQHTPPELTENQEYCDCGPGWFYQYFRVHKKWIGWPIAEHSATSWWNCESHVGCWSYFETSNHGENASGMGVNCANVSPWKWQGYEDLGSAGACDWYSGYASCGMWGGNHNCHDDSKFQKERIICGGTPAGMCTGAGCDVHAPGYCGC